MRAKEIGSIVESDVLVIGSGLAGSLAAISCHKSGRKVVIATGGRLCWGGSTVVCGGNTLAICFPEDEGTSWMREYVEGSDYIADQEWVKIFIDESYGYAMELNQLARAYGEIIFPPEPRKEGDKPWRIKRYANDNPLVIYDCYATLTALRKHVVANRIGFFERMEMTRLLTDGERVVGAVGFNYRTGETFLFKARAIVLATGTCNFWTEAFDASGEGYAMAYEIGGRMKSFDRGGARVRPRFTMFSGSLCNPTVSSLAHALGGKLVNNLGEAFWARVSSSSWASGRLGVDRAIRSEIAEGRGPVFEDFTQIVPEVREVLKRIRKAHWKLTKAKHGVDPFEARIPTRDNLEQTIVPDANRRAGGVDVDHQCATKVPGLYAVGDTTWPAMGFQHPRVGAGLGWALLSGSRVGRFAADYVGNAPGSGAGDKEMLGQCREHLASLALPLTRTEGPSPAQVMSRLLCCLIPYDEVHSDRDHMERALTEIARIQTEELPNLAAKDPHALRKAVQVKSMTLTAEMILRSELFRQESRCGMRRKDFPMTDNINWLKWIVLEKRDGRMHVYATDVPSPYIEPPRTIYSPRLDRV